MKINNTNSSPSFQNNLSPLSNVLYTLQNNDMLNASFIDIFAMDTPRTLVEFRHRGKNAGLEMGFREYTGTFIAEFSATVFALLFSKIYAKNKNINPNSWATNKSIETFTSVFENSDKTPISFVEKSLESMSGLAGKTINKYTNNSESTVKNLVKLITDPSIDKKQTKELLKTTQDNIIQNLKADSNITLKSGDKEFSSNLSHMLRDMVDLGKNVFFKDGINYKDAVSKLKNLNKSRIACAIPLSMLLAITNQYINRKITKKRTGIDNFVGENGYSDNVNQKKEKGKEKGLLAKKCLSAGVFLAMLTAVMGLKKPSDLVNKLEFTGPATGGNAIKTIYGTLILGRIFASKDSTELRETTVRDYLGFLSWLVLGGFVAKGVGQAFDPKQQKLFNVSKEGNGIGHWLKNVSLKSQKEIMAQGGNVKQNLRNLNIAQLSGMAYSAVMLGVLLPKLNIWMTRRKAPKNNPQQENNNQSLTFTKNLSMDNFIKQTKAVVK